MFMWTAEAPDMPAPDSAIVCIEQRRFGDAEPRAAVFLRHRDPQPAVLRERGVEIVRKAALAVALEPVVEIEARADLRDRVADRFLLGRE